MNGKKLTTNDTLSSVEIPLNIKGLCYEDATSYQRCVHHRNTYLMSAR